MPESPQSSPSLATREPRGQLGVFLSAEWRNLLMLNYEVAASVLSRHVPAGCELDLWDGRALVSVVAFQFLDTRVLGIPVPFHRDFEEVNLRFYVRHRAEDGWRRGVVFIKEIVPRRAIAFVARVLYGENYVALPMRHAVSLPATVAGDNPERGSVSYEWRQGPEWEGATARLSGPCFTPPDDAEATFITEHYWGYARQRSGATVEYQVEHPRWAVWEAADASLNCDVTSLYGSEFDDFLAAPPRSAFVADGSPIIVRKGRVLK